MSMKLSLREIEEAEELLAILDHKDTVVVPSHVTTGEYSRTVAQVPLYNVQCTFCLHVFEAAPGTELDRRATAREKAGFVDALPICPDECPACIRRNSN